MTRTKLKERTLPAYSPAEECCNMVTHIVGGGVGVLALIACVITSALHRDPWAVVSSAVYGAALVVLFTVSSVYHGLHPGIAKKVMQVIDHCAIYFLIAGTYTPILLVAIRPVYPITAWAVFGVEWGLTALAVTLTAIDLKKYAKFSMICYIGMGWCVVFALRATLQTVSLAGCLWLLLGGIFYTIGAVLYALGKKRRYVHALFHLFVNIGSMLHAVCILFFVV